MKKLLIIGVPLLFIVLLCTLCFGLLVFGYYQGKGSGEVEEETRDVEAFSKIVLKGQGKIILDQGDEVSVEIKADDNILKRIETKVKDDELMISYKKQFPFYWGDVLFPSEDITYYITVEDLSKLKIQGAGSVESDFLDLEELDLTIEGAGEIKFEEFYADSIEIDVSGAGDIEIEGEVETQKINIDGAGEYKAIDLNSEDCEITVNGAGDAQVYVTGNLEVNISGAGEVKYDGDPDNVEKDISGLGKLKEL